METDAPASVNMHHHTVLGMNPELCACQTNTPSAEPHSWPCFVYVMGLTMWPWLASNSPCSPCWSRIHIFQPQPPQCAGIGVYRHTQLMTSVLGCILGRRLFFTFAFSVRCHTNADGYFLRHYILHSLPGAMWSGRCVLCP